jgi:sporulation protein YunB
MRFKMRKRVLMVKVSSAARRRIARNVVVAALCLVFIGVFFFFDFKIRPVLKYLAEAKAKQIATRAINEAISFNVAPDIKYQNLINVKFDKDGKVAFMQPNTGEINRLAARATLAVQNRMKNLSPQTVQLPLGQVFGLKALSGFGPNLPVKLYSLGIVESSITDSFDVAGINQIRHRININIKALVKIVVPLVYQHVQIDTRVLLTEAIVMGQVPNIYVNSGGLIIPGDSQK